MYYEEGNKYSRRVSADGSGDLVHGDQLTQRYHVALYRADADYESVSRNSITLIDVLDPHNIVLTEIASGLHLDQLERNLALVGQAVDGADRNVD